ncbi:MAG: alpha/beta fold hydrolase [Actinoallomurus sp.]
MPAFAAPDGTELTYHVMGSGSAAPVVCLPGGPMRASAYLGDLGGLAAHRPLVRLDLRGTGASAEPEDPASYRCDRQIDDVEALREHLGLDRMALLGHSAGGGLAIRYATRHPERIDRLALITPSTRAIRATTPTGVRRQVLKLREAEPWFASASPAFEKVAAGTATREDWAAVAPMAYGRWDAAAKAHQADEGGQRNGEAARIFNSTGAFDPARTRAALASVAAPVLLLAGDLDWIITPAMAADFAGLFPDARLVVQTGAAHYPWLDDAAGFVATVATFLG